MARILLTGASGFIGRALAPSLISAGHDVVAPGRAEIGDIGPQTDWSRLLDGATCVIHLAGLAHARRDGAAFMRVNAESTGALAKQAAQAGVTRFVFMSSVKAAADGSDRALTETDAAAPGTPYGRSKLAAEQAVFALPELNAVALRPPLVHCWDAGSNFGALLRLAASPLPLPFAGSSNRRSLMGRVNLVDAMHAVLARPEICGVFYVADTPALSTSEMVTALRSGLGQAPNQFAGSFVTAFGPSVLRESLEVDPSKFEAAFAFPARDSRAALAATAAKWKTQRR